MYYTIVIHADKGRIAKCLKEIAEVVEEEEYILDHWSDKHYDVTITKENEQ